jgi:hypothetical protein
MLAGAVVIDETGVATGVGLAKEIFDDYLPKFPAIPAGPLGSASKQQIADLCNSFASKTIAHVLTNITIVVPPGVAVATAGTAAAQTGATTAPGVATVA